MEIRNTVATYKGIEIKEAKETYKNPAFNQSGYAFSFNGITEGIFQTIGYAKAKIDKLTKRTVKDDVKFSPKMEMCDCGHEEESAFVMSTSQGTSCSMCYDRMS